MSLSLAELLRLRLLRTLSALSLVAVFASGCGASASTQAGGAYNAGSPPPPPPPVAKESSAEMSAVAPGAGPSKSSPTAGATADSAVEKKKAEDPNRPGLATHWGENRHSPITSTTFERANSISPMAVGSLWYNDREGARASASAEGYRSTTRAGIEIASGGVTISVRDENGAMLPGYSAGGKTFAIGEAGRRYTLVITNNTPARFEIVASVDGLDVLDGTAASYIKRGYIIRPNSTLEIEGFRRSDQTVAAFRFGDVRGSYAGRKGDDRNVGVIGIAVFHEQGTQPWPWGPSEIEKRRQADPFPGRYAEPPPLSIVSRYCMVYLSRAVRFSNGLSLHRCQPRNCEKTAMTFTLSSLLRNRLLRSLAALSLLASLASGCAATSQPAQQSRHQGYRPPMATASGQDAEEAYPGYPSQQSGGGYPGGNPGVYPMPTSAPPPPAPGKAESRSAGASIPKDYDKRAPEPNRPGLATHWGENRYSPISTTSFNRANWDSPMSVGTLWYNDREGARASASVEGYRSTTRAGIEIASGGVTISVRDENGAMLPGYSAGGKTFAIGEAGRRYTLVITNNTPARFEIVTSVDGLDVLDGTAASYTKRGYIVRPNSTLEIEGFRRSDQTVAAFRFGDVRGSYAGKKGDDRNVGVIGIAVFHEQGTQPWPWGPSEIDRRRQADPFPGRYAEPPP